MDLLIVFFDITVFYIMLRNKPPIYIRKILYFSKPPTYMI